MSTSELITVFVSLLVIIDPVALAPLFIALTKGQSARRRRIVGLRAGRIAFDVPTSELSEAATADLYRDAAQMPEIGLRAVT